MTPSARDSDAAARTAMDAAELLQRLDGDVGVEASAATPGLFAVVSEPLDVLGFEDLLDLAWTNSSNVASGVAQDAVLVHDCEHLQALHLDPLHAASDDNRVAGFYTKLLGASESNSPEVVDAQPLSIAKGSNSTATSPPVAEHHEGVPVKKKKPASQRRREELEYLRTKVEDLEGSLKKLKSTHPATVEEQQTRDHGESLGSFWEQTAKRQVSAKKQAEQENIRLREQLRRQIKLAKSLERTLRSRKVWEVLQESRQQRLLEIDSTDSSILAMLKHNVNVRASNLNPLLDELQQKRDTIRRSAASLEPQIVVDPLNGMNITLAVNVLIPFGVHKVADSVWNMLRVKNLKLTGLSQNAHVLEQAGDVLALKQTTVLGVGNTGHYTRAHTVFKRVVEEHRVLFLWETVKEIRQSPSKEAPVVHVVTNKGSTLFVEDDEQASGAATLGLSSICVIPTVAAEDSAGLPRQTGAPGLLTELIISSLEQKAQLMLQFLENALFDDLVKAAAGRVGVEPS